MDKINSDYINALIEEFDIRQKLIQQLTDKINTQTLEASYISNKVNPPIDFA